MAEAFGLTPEQEIQRGQEAAILLRNPLLVETLDEIERATIQKWEMAEAKETREDFWRLYKVAKLFRQALQSHIETGKLAELQLQQEKRGLAKLWSR